MQGPPQQGSDPAPVLVGHFFRHEYGRLVAILARRVGVRHLEKVEDAVQTALMAALSSWAAESLPRDPGAWLYRVAHNHLMGTLRGDRGRRRILERPVPAPPEGHEEAAPPRFGGEMGDDLLRMLFICCDEAVPKDSSLVFALKALCGFSIPEIALRLFISEANAHKRFARARDRLRGISPDLQMLPLTDLGARLPSVHAVLYLLFNEGYLSTHPDRAIRRELCDEAIRLGELLAGHPVGAVPETHALLALMCFHGARLPSRLDPLCRLLLLEEQDRSAWDAGLMRRGAEWLEKSARGGTFSRYHAEAGIAAEHCFAPSFAQTRWKEITELYALLEKIEPSPLNAMNRAVAMAEWQGPEAALLGLQEVEPPPWLLGFHLWDAVLGDLQRRAGRPGPARNHFERALAAAPSEAERELLRRKIDSPGDAAFRA